MAAWDNRPDKPRPLEGPCSAPTADRARRFSTALIASTALTILLAQIIPVAGPFSAFGNIKLPAACFSDVTAFAGTVQYLQLRNHALHSIDFTAISGLIAFPSYHATAAILLTYFMRRIPVLFICTAVINAAMIAAIPVVGGHYLIDVLAGIAVAAATIWIVERLDRSVRGSPAALSRVRDNR